MENIWSEWSQYYAELGLDPSNICRDGIANPTKFDSAKQRILFILRESDNWPGGDIRTLMDPPRYQALHTIGRWAFGLLNNFPPFEEANLWRNFSSALSQVALINLKKYSGGPVADTSIINAYASQDKHLLSKQISDICPNIIVAGGTMDTLIWLLELNPQPHKGLNIPLYSSKYKSLVIPSRHPVRCNNEKTYAELSTSYSLYKY